MIWVWFICTIYGNHTKMPSMGRISRPTCTAILSIIGTFTDFIGVRMKMRGQDISSFNQNSEIQFNLRQKK